ncbi:MAG: hypothetical protein QM691_03365 [Opitutaceae bacterium]
MQTRLLALGRRAWQFLTVVPGWPDASRAARLLYALPLIVPLVAFAGLLGWSTLRAEPRERKVRARCQPSLQLDAEIAELRLTCSDEEAVAASQALEHATADLARTPEQAGARLAAIQSAALARGWVATLHANDAVTVAEGAPIAYRTIRGRLDPVPGNPQPFSSLLTALEEMFPPGAHASLTRLTVRADEQGRCSAELGGRLAVLPADAQTP